MKLKTLEDIEIVGEYGHGYYKKLLPYCISKELKQEAIKWIKNIKTDFPDICDLDCGIHKGHWTHDNILLHTALGKIDWIKHFFNITEEDLK